MAVLFEAVLALLAVYGLWNVVQVLLRYFASSETQAPHIATTTTSSRAPLNSYQDSTTVYTRTPDIATREALDERQAVPELRVVLLGTTGTGKSATGNTLLGTKKFAPSAARKSCTQECSVAEVDRFGTRLVVVDTPGVLDTGMSDEDIEVMLKECTHLACPGVHAFLFLMKIGDRDIGGKDEKTFDLITKMFENLQKL
ncbi:GTPase IMAP family member 4-like isoform X2 [Argopecten irradians]|uniref:GTPase IMAP family member 4-like isoform X2 n=1 Tax=Argopecten irradians TaxID=31199 RepID=UPI00371DEBFC